ncbi:MAG: hypothetical protein HA493_05810, partial [Candidatus Verstraetearchaeota archaeon]|nr:hypothetical protein [Candidatus Verstraetearchaeota archaeon]
MSSIGGKLMDQQIIELHENHEALHGGKYYFIIENNRIIHISPVSYTHLTLPTIL